MIDIQTNFNLIWLKRDLRLQDHLPLLECSKSDDPTILWYCFEPMLMEDEHYSSRHFQFIYESLADLNEQLAAYNTRLLITYGDVIGSLECLSGQVNIKRILSHQETGISKTYGRDNELSFWCKLNDIEWKEYQSNGVQRGRTNRDNWENDWTNYMNAPIPQYDLKDVNWIATEELDSLTICFEHYWRIGRDNNMQKGGEKAAHEMLQSFLSERISRYVLHISQPLKSRKYCSRLSPHIAWGNLSIRQVYQAAAKKAHNAAQKNQFEAFMARLRWHCHFIQKFEMECEMEYQAINRAFDKLHKEVNEDFIAAWESGNTGYPLVDASMRCLNSTGYLNFRMRAMLLSFFVHHLWQPWQRASHYLARQFLDFEPGIHYPQIQMQAGETGVNALRIYNPVKQSYDQDPDAEFIREWVPELSALPDSIIHEPWKMTLLDQQFYDFIPGVNYTLPIVDIEVTGKRARRELAEFRKTDEVNKESERIVKKHTLAGRMEERIMS